jgi:hypothetical protein
MADATSELTSMLRALEAFQVARLRRDFADLMVERQYQALGEFFFSELYAPRDFSERNTSARQLHAMLRAVPGVRVSSLDRALRLMELTGALDDRLAHLLLAGGIGPGFDEPAYERAYRAADAYAAREEQLRLIIATVQDVFELSRLPLIVWHMRQVQPLAQSLGFGALARFLLHSLEAVQPVRDLNRFTNTLWEREKRRLDRIYTSAAGASQLAAPPPQPQS